MLISGYSSIFCRLFFGFDRAFFFLFGGTDLLNGLSLSLTEKELALTV